MKPDIRISADLNSLNLVVAEELLRLVRQDSHTDSDFSIALAGGNTPKKLYQLLAQKPFSNTMPWGELRLFFGDERIVPPTSHDSNYKMVDDNLIKKINIDPLRIHRIHGEMNPHAAADAYTQVLTNFLFIENDLPQFDLVLLGLGTDGHIASLFPDTDIIDDQTSIAAPVHINKPDSWRVSVTLPVINNAKNIWILVSGDTKQDMIDRVFNHPSVTDLLPIERLSKTSNITWFLDAKAAHWLN